MHYVLEPLIIIKILTNTIGFQHCVLEPLKILTDTIGFQHYVLEPLKILTITIGFQHCVLEPLIIMIIVIIKKGKTNQCIHIYMSTSEKRRK